MICRLAIVVGPFDGDIAGEGGFMGSVEVYLKKGCDTAREVFAEDRVRLIGKGLCVGQPLLKHHPCVRHSDTIITKYGGQEGFFCFVRYADFARIVQTVLVQVPVAVYLTASGPGLGDGISQCLLIITANNWLRWIAPQNTANIGQAQVSTSADELFDMGYLKEDDAITMNPT